MNLGIDLGTSYTKMGIVDKQGKWINLVKDEGMIPSLASFIPRTGRLYFGAAATSLREAGIQVSKFFKIEIKRNPRYCLGPFDLGDLVSSFLVYLREKYVDQSRADSLKTVTIGVPNYFGLRARRLVLQAARHAFPEVPVRLALEPLAALAGLLHERAIAGQAPLTGSFLILDIGGGTVDASFTHISRMEGTRVTLESQLHTGSDAFSGAEIDKAILRQVLIPRFEMESGQSIPAAIKKEKGMTSEEAYQYARMLKWAEEVKLGGNDTEHLHLDLPGFYNQYSLRIDLDREDLFPVMEDTLGRLRQFLETTVKPRAQRLGLCSGNRWHLDGVILMGGSSRLEGVEPTIIELMGTELVRPQNPELYVVKGLAQPLETGKQWPDLQTRVMLPFRFFIEKLTPAAPQSSILEPIPFDTTNLELDPEGIYHLCSVPYDNSYNLSREPGMFRFKIYQGGDDDEAAVRTDPEAMVLDVSYCQEDLPVDGVNVFLDLSTSCLKTGLEQAALTAGENKEWEHLWEQALMRQEETISKARLLQPTPERALNAFGEKLQEMKSNSPLKYYDYNDMMVAKLLAFFEVLTK